MADTGIQFLPVWVSREKFRILCSNILRISPSGLRTLCSIMFWYTFKKFIKFSSSFWSREERFVQCKFNKDVYILWYYTFCETKIQTRKFPNAHTHTSRIVLQWDIINVVFIVFEQHYFVKPDNTVLINLIFSV
jgi:hypothetical protein